MTTTPSIRTGQAPATLSREWLATRDKLANAQARWADAATPSRVLVICASARNKHMAGRVYGVIVHGDVAGVESHRRNLTDRRDWMGLVDAGMRARLDRYIGYYGPYVDSHDTLDRDEAVQQESCNVAESVVAAVTALRAGRLSRPDAQVRAPRTK